MYPVDPMLSRPVEVNFAGWRSDTYALQKSGWQIAADEDIRRQTMRLAMSHRGAGIQAITDEVPWEYIHTGRMMPPRHVIHVSVMHRDIRMEMIGRVEPRFNLIDATPQLRPQRELVSLEDYCHFAKPKSIIIPEPTVANLMEEILKLQKPGMDEHYQQLAREGMKTRPAATIIGLSI